MVKIGRNIIGQSDLLPKFILAKRKGSSKKLSSKNRLLFLWLYSYFHIIPFDNLENKIKKLTIFGLYTFK